MKRTDQFLGRIILAAVILVAGCAKQQQPVFSTLKDPANVAQLKQFVAEKEAQANRATNEAAPGFALFFAAARSGDWLAISNAFNDLRQHSGQSENSGKVDERLRGPRWEAVKEIWGTFYFFGVGDEKYSAAFANGIIHSIPPGSIYFGGTDAGRFLVTGMEKSQVNADPFFLLSQNPLADEAYLQYLRAMYGGKIHTPTDADLQKSFQDYTADAQRRLAHDQQFPNEPRQLKPGEDVKMDANGQIQLSGQMNVMGIRELLTKNIFDENPDREFYVEESFPLDWMYPQLEPHGLIFKLDRQPMANLPDEIIQRDHDYWANYVAPVIGDWLKDDTSVAEISEFAEKVYAKKDFSGFKGDPRFIQNSLSQKMFSKLRSSIAGIYAWRVKHPAGAEDKERMERAADFAFRQAWALCPYSPEPVFRYVNFLVEQKRVADAVVVAETAAKMPEMKGADGAQLRALVEQLKKFQERK